MSEAPLPNSPEARSPDGTILDQTSTQTQSPNPTSSTPTPESKSNEPAPAPAAPAVPESYTFKTPEGAEPNQALIDAATPVFKELGLSQAQADKLIDLYNAQSKSSLDSAVKIIKAQGAEWEAQVKADPELGPNLDKIKIDVGRALDARLTPTERDAFRTAMDQTMVGNNPAFVRAFWKLAQGAAPGTHVTGGGPSPHGQSANGAAQRPSAASAMWPNLKAS